MLSLRAASVLTTLVALGGALGLTGTRLVAAASQAASRLTAPLPGDAERLLLGVVGVALTGIGLWTWAVTLTCACDLARPGLRRHDGLLRPSRVRAAVLRACVPTLGAVVVCTAGPVAADTGDSGDPAPSSAAQLTGLSLPTRPVSHEDPRPRVRRVHAGECLWTVAEDLLGPGASAEQVSRAWHVLYRANRDRIGPDPDLVHVGTRLEVPPGLVPTTTPTR